MPSCKKINELPQRRKGEKIREENESIYICILQKMVNNSPVLNHSKKNEVELMFNSIAWRYDFLNHFLSFGIDTIWRKKAIRQIGKTHKPSLILDVATGTADLAIASLKLKPLRVTGIDISNNMLEKGRNKINRKGLTEKIELMLGDSEKIAFVDNFFDVAMVAFGVRNFGDLLKGLREMHRVIQPGGLIMVLEFSKPLKFPFRQVYNFYFMHILPFFGRLFSKNRSAYRYLPDSVMNFPDNEIFIRYLERAGFSDVNQTRLTGGVATIYTGIKAPVQ